MNITFLIGNGFDLNLGFKTGFKDFLNYYTKITDDDSDVIKKFKSDIVTFPDLWSDVELALGQYTQNFSGKQGAEDYMECFEHIKKELCTYLQSKLERVNIPLLTSTIGSSFAQCLINYKDKFRDAPRKRLEEIEAQTHSVLNFQFISFNYTNTLDRLIEDSSTCQEIEESNQYIQLHSPLHIHGHTTQGAILGLNHEGQIANRSLFDELDPFEIDLLIKSNVNLAYENNTEKKAQELINSADIIYIYGMALGDTDTLWWDTIIDAMIINPKLRTLIHVFNCPSRSLNLRSFRRIDFETRGRLFSRRKAVITSELSSRIHIADFNIFDSIEDKANECPANLQWSFEQEQT